MNIGCYLIKEDGSFKEALIPEEFLLAIIKKLKEEGKETIHFNNKISIEIEGIYIPAKGTK